MKSIIRKIKNSYKTILKVSSVVLFIGTILLCSQHKAKAQINVSSPTFTFVAFTNTTTSNYYSLITNSCKIAKIQLFANSATVSYINLYDSATTNSSGTNGAYTNYLSYTTNIATTNISLLTGITNIQTNLVFYETNVSFAAATNALPFRTFAVGPSSSATYDNLNLLMSRGAAFLANTNITVIITYRIND